jgi:HlyD family secretion protein
VLPFWGLKTDPKEGFPMAATPTQSGWLSKILKRWNVFPLWKRLVTILVPVLLVGAGILLYTQVLIPSRQTEEPALQTTTVKRGDIVLYASGTGSLKPLAEASVGFQSGGTIKAIHTAVGEEVTAGQLLAELDDTSVQVQLTQAKRALRELTSPAALANAQKDLAVALQTETTARRDLVYLISPDVLYWEEQLAAAEAALANAKDPNAASLSDLQKAVSQAKAGLSYVRVKYQEDYVPQEFTVTEMDDKTHQWVTYIAAPTDAEIAESRAAYAQARIDVQEFQYLVDALQGGEVPADATGSGLTSLENARQNVESAQHALESTKIYAPISGTVTSLNGAVGDTVGTSALLTVQDLSQPYRLTVYLDESDWDQIKADYPVEVTFDILPDSVLTGKVVSVNPVLTQSAGASVIEADVRLDKSTPAALPMGTSATVDVIGGSAKNAILVSIDALHDIGGGEYTVFVVVDGKPKVRSVKIGLMDAVNAEVISGLEEGDVVTTGILVTK